MVDKTFLPARPRTVYKYACQICGNPFKTNYRYQKYCLDPCKHVVEKKVVIKAEKQTNKQMSDRRKERQEAKRLNSILNRKYLTRKL